MISDFVFIGEMILRRNAPSLEFGSSKLNSVSLATFIPCGESKGLLNSPGLSVEVWKGIFTYNHRISEVLGLLSPLDPVTVKSVKYQSLYCHYYRQTPFPELVRNPWIIWQVGQAILSHVHDFEQI